MDQRLNTTMSYAFPPVYQPWIRLWSPFSRIEPISEVYNEKITKVEQINNERTVELYNKTGAVTEIKIQKNSIDFIV